MIINTFNTDLKQNSQFEFENNWQVGVNELDGFSPEIRFFQKGRTFHLSTQNKLEDIIASRETDPFPFYLTIHNIYQIWDKITYDHGVQLTLKTQIRNVFTRLWEDCPVQSKIEKIITKNMHKISEHMAFSFPTPEKFTQGEKRKRHIKRPYDLGRIKLEISQYERQLLKIDTPAFNLVAENNRKVREKKQKNKKNEQANSS